MFHVKQNAKEILISGVHETPRVIYNVPASKSLLARDIMLYKQENIPSCRIISILNKHIRKEELSGDIDTLLAAIENQEIHDCKESGTALRFLTAHFATKVGKHLITASPRLRERPIKGLIDILEQAGAKFEYLCEPYQPPYYITNDVGTLEFPEEINAISFPSGQYISALLLAFCNSTFNIEGAKSLSYVYLTQKRMELFGYQFKIKKDYPCTLQLLRGKELYSDIPDLHKIGDWTAAWYWIAYVILHPTLMEIEIKGLTLNSHQPDESFLEKGSSLFALTVSETNNGVRISVDKEQLKRPPHPTPISFKQNPDLMLTIGVIHLGLQWPFHFSDTAIQRYKESDRLRALIENGSLVDPKGDWKIDKVYNHLIYTPSNKPLPTQENPIPIKSYNDHRVVMSFAILAASGATPNSYLLSDPKVVDKSFPSFWTELYQ